jgi:hypothetical protein
MPLAPFCERFRKISQRTNILQRKVARFSHHVLQDVHTEGRPVVYSLSDNRKASSGELL